MKFTLTTTFFIVLFSVAHAQEQSNFMDGRKQLIGLNITSTLAGFFNSGGQNLPKDPYLFSYKVLKNNKMYRLAGNFKTVVRREDLLGFGTRDTKENGLFLRVGMEKLEQVTNRFSLFYGLDMVGVYEQSSSESVFSGSLASKTASYGGGLGPFLGIYFKITDRIYLSTEAYAYGIIGYSTDKTEIGSGVPDQGSNEWNFSLLPAIPNSLYINFAF